MYSFIFWLVIFLVTSSLVIAPKSIQIRAISMFVFAGLFFGLIYHDRLVGFTPVDDVPPPMINYVYNMHKVHIVNGEIYVLLWISDLDKHSEVVYNFPLKGNEDLRKDLDRLRKRIQEQKMSPGPYQFLEAPDTTHSAIEGMKMIIEPKGYGVSK